MSQEQMRAPVPQPSVKGWVFLMGIQGVKRLMDEGRLSREEVEFELRAGDIRYLEEKILAESWYPVASFDRFADIAVDAFFNGDSSRLVEQGELAAAKLVGSQSYQSQPGTSRTISDTVQLMLSFSRWELDNASADGSFEIRVSDAGELPESLRHAAQGFIQHLATIEAGEPRIVSSERLDQETIVYRGQPSPAE